MSRGDPQRVQTILSDLPPLRAQIVKLLQSP